MRKRRSTAVRLAGWIVLLAGLLAALPQSGFARASVREGRYVARMEGSYSDRMTDTLPARYDVVWDEPGPGSAQSMPIGNGDIGLNVWVEKKGDLVFFIGKTDAWGEDLVGQKDEWMRQGGMLMKLGAVRVSADPNPLAASQDRRPVHFRQTLRLGKGEIEIEEGSGTSRVAFRVWVDANHPVIHVETRSSRPVIVKAALEDWRLNETAGTKETGGSNEWAQSPDTVLEGLKNRIAWYHHNLPTADPHLVNLCFGGIIEGEGFVGGERRAGDAGGLGREQLQSGKSLTQQMLSIYPYTTTAGGGSEWYTRLNKQVSGLGKLDPAKTQAAHRQWWKKFWQRSWVFVEGEKSGNRVRNVKNDSLAEKVTEGYLLQRFVTACAGRGAYPVKFNGSIFVVGKPSSHINADWRDWGGQYWFQNTRAMYWPRLMAGDFDILQPLFRMYADMLPGNTKQVREYYHHGGAYFAETSPFWGGVDYTGPESKANYTAHYFTPILELSMMMLDYYEYTGDTAFARTTLLPVASAGLQFFDEHFGRDSLGKLLLDPDNANETFWKVSNPAPDLAGLMAVLGRMIDLPARLVDEQPRSYWKKMLAELPPLPLGHPKLNNNATIRPNGYTESPVLLPYTGPQTAEASNSENPELYAVYPFRLFGLSKSDRELELAAGTFYNRKNRDKGCWTPDGIQAAMIGDADIAKEYMSFDLTNRDSVLKFPAFWLQSDYVPDEDNGGNGENALQQMLMQVDGKKILLLPAWPAGWNADFKLHAPFRTTVEGRVVGGKLVRLKVEPTSRLVDVMDMSKKKKERFWSGK